MITMYNGDCIEYMAAMPDNAYDLAIVDPPYGNGGNAEWDKKSRGRFGGIFGKYIITRTNDCISMRRSGFEDIEHWDIAPGENYFRELFRVSKNQIIWGGNYFSLPPSRNFIVWRKLTISESFSMAMCEYAWTSIQGNAKIFEYPPQDKSRFHPTQKPVALYKWLLKNYANPGDKILDTHGGSGSICIACHDMGYDLTWIEIDKNYYNAACERYKLHAVQKELWHIKGGEIYEG